uniref:Uncharacterized protein n=1 Tax=Ditylenchus dipsaci TaxID=166011 RepID=A0A915DHI3_9BILA
MTVDKTTKGGGFNEKPTAVAENSRISKLENNDKMCRKQDVRAMIISQKDKKDSATQTFGMDTRVDGIALSIKDAFPMKSGLFAPKSAPGDHVSLIGLREMKAIFGLVTVSIHGTFEIIKRIAVFAIWVLLEHPRYLIILFGITHMLFGVGSVLGFSSTDLEKVDKSELSRSLPAMIPFSGVLLTLVGVICGLYARQNSAASFFHKVLLRYGLLAIGFSLIAGYFILNTYQSLTTFVSNNALLVLMLLSSIVRPDNMDEFCRQQLILVLRTCGFVAFGLLVGLMSWFSENYRYTLIEGIPVVYAWLTAWVEYMNGTKHFAHLALVPLPDDDAESLKLQEVCRSFYCISQSLRHFRRVLSHKVPVYSISKKKVWIGLLSCILLISVCVLIYSLKPSNIETKFFDLVVAEYNDFDPHKKQEFKKHIYDFSSKPSNIDTKFFDLLMGEYNGFDLHKKKEFKNGWTAPIGRPQNMKSMEKPSHETWSWEI